MILTHYVYFTSKAHLRYHYNHCLCCQMPQRKHSHPCCSDAFTSTYKTWNINQNIDTSKYIFIVYIDICVGTARAEYKAPTINWNTKSSNMSRDSVRNTSRLAATLWNRNTKSPATCPTIQPGTCQVWHGLDK